MNDRRGPMRRRAVSVSCAADEEVFFAATPSRRFGVSWRRVRGFVAGTLALASAGLAGCASLGGSRAALCASHDVSVFADFPGAGRHDCVIAPDGSIIVSVDHEPSVADGINPSPWYALRLHAARPGVQTLVLDYTDYKHRYSPEISRDRETWRSVREEVVLLSEDETRAVLALDLSRGDTWLAGQPVVTANEQVRWARSQMSSAGFAEVEYGRSEQGRPLVGFVGGNANAKEMIVAITRQHPPETTGQDAFRGFVETLTAGTGAMETLLESHRVLLAPMANPDGVDGGHWRLNRGGIDLNRDWGPFTQPESRALSSWILDEAADRQVVAFLDFHSTNRNVIYAPPLDAASPTIDFLPYLEARFAATISDPPAWSYAHNENGGTSKGWALEALRAPGVTVELWDEIAREDAWRIGAVIAEAAAAYFAREAVD